MGEDRPAPFPRAARADAPARGDRAGARAVELERRAVAPLLVEVVARDEQRQVGRLDELDPPVEGVVLRVGVDVDRAPPRLLDDRIAARVEVIPLEREAERPLRLGQEEVDVQRVARAEALLEEGGALDGPAREDVDDATEGVVAPDARAAAAHDLDLLDRLERHAVPVDPAAEGVVERYPVEEDERAARPGGSDAAEGEALGRRMPDDARRAPEEAEARHLAQQVVHRLARRVGHVVARDDRHRGRRVSRLLLHPGRRDDNGLETRGSLGRLRRGGGDEADDEHEDEDGATHFYRGPRGRRAPWVA